MKKYILIGLMLLSSGNVLAQIDKIVGNWVEKQHMQVDTLVSAREFLDKDYNAYVKGYKILDPDYTVVRDVYPEEDEKLKITITKEQDFFWAVDGNKFKQKIAYDAENKNYFIIIPGYFTNMNLIVKYDENTKNLQFIQSGSEYIFYEFMKKE
jgi:hypothetical protein